MNLFSDSYLYDYLLSKRQIMKCIEFQKYRRPQKTPKKCIGRKNVIWAEKDYSLPFGINKSFLNVFL